MPRAFTRGAAPRCRPSGRRFCLATLRPMRKPFPASRAKPPISSGCRCRRPAGGAASAGQLSRPCPAGRPCPRPRRRSLPATWPTWSSTNFGYARFSSRFLARNLSWGSFRERLYLHNVLRAAVDADDLARLGPALAQASDSRRARTPGCRLSTTTTCTPGATSWPTSSSSGAGRTVEVFAKRSRVDPAEFAALLASPRADGTARLFAFAAGPAGRLSRAGVVPAARGSSAPTGRATAPVSAIIAGRSRIRETQMRYSHHRKQRPAWTRPAAALARGGGH